MFRQTTLRNSMSAKGIGLHTGKLIHITIRPAQEDTGIVFNRVDLHNVSIQCKATNVTSTELSTTISNGKGEPSVSTVEHLMAAFAGLGIDNVYVDLDGPEVPIMDGSSSAFIFLIQSAGLTSQNKLRKVIRIKKEVRVNDGDKHVCLKPYDGFKVDYSIDFNHPLFNDKPKTVSIDFSKQSFKQELSRARTFGFINDIEKLRSKGLVLGGSTDNAIVIDDYRIINKDGLRYNDEFVKHKVLDSIGDLYLLGSPILGHLSAHKSGHNLNNKLVRTILQDESCWEYVKNDYSNYDLYDSLEKRYNLCRTSVFG